MNDKKALQILFQTYWNSKGWKDKRTISSDDFEYAKAYGYMFDDILLSHDDAVAWLVKSFNSVQLENVTNSFLASLTSRKLELRSALGSFAVNKNFQPHKFTGENGCDICGVYETSLIPEDLSVLNFERFKWGGIRHNDPNYAAFDLERFSQIDKVQSNNQGLYLLNHILKIADNLPPNARVRDLEKSLSKVVASNKSEREVLIQILGYCGMLQPKNKQSYFTNYIKQIDQDCNSEWNFPVCRWRGADGVNKEAVTFYFPQLYF